MESIKQSINDLASHFNNTMSEFQKNLSTSIPATSPTSNLAAQFSSFRTFILSALENLQLQVKYLSEHQDQLETNSRKKVLLVHGIKETKSEDITNVTVETLSHHLHMPDLNKQDVSYCHRIGSSKGDKTRPVLIKFKQLSVRNHVWYSKTKLKGSGCTISEFLTKNRHEAFMTARQRVGLSNCWTKNGAVFVIAPDGSRHRICSRSDLDIIPGLNDGVLPPTGADADAVKSSKPRTAPPALANRSKRVVKK